MSDERGDVEARRAELEEERDFLLRSLDDLDAERAAGDVEEDDYRRLKDDYTARAAVVLRRLDRLEAPDGAAPAVDRLRGASASASAAAAGRRRSRLPLVVAAVLTLAFGGTAGYLLTRSSGERLPDEAATGQAPPQSTRARLEQAFQLESAGQITQAAQLYDAVLEAEPTNVVALTQKGWILGRSGRQAKDDELLNGALPYFDKAIATDPTFPDARVFKGLVLAALGRSGDASCELRAYLALAPPDEPQNRAVEEVLGTLVQQAGPTAPACQAPPAPRPATSAPAPAPPAPVAP